MAIINIQAMKEEVIKTIIQKMGRELDYRQQSRLRDILHECLNCMQICIQENDAVVISNSN